MSNSGGSLVSEYSSRKVFISAFRILKQLPDMKNVTCKRRKFLLKTGTKKIIMRGELDGQKKNHRMAPGI